MLRAALFLLALIACAEPRITLAPPDAPAGAAVGLLAVQGAEVAPRFHAFRAAAPPVLREELPAPVALGLIYLAEELPMLGVEAGEVMDQPGGRALPDPIAGYTAVLDPDSAPAWRKASEVPALFSGLRLPPRPTACRPIEVEQHSLSALRIREVGFAGARSLDQVVFGGGPSDGLFSIDARYQVRALAAADPVSAVAGELAGDTGGRVGRIRSAPGAGPLSVDWLPEAVPEGAAVVELLAAPWGETLVLTSSGALYRGGGAGGWALAWRFPRERLSSWSELVAAPDGAAAYAVRSSAPYVVEVTPRAVQTSTVSGTGLSTLAFSRVSGTAALYAGDRDGRIFVRDGQGQWSLLVDTQISDPILALYGGERLVYVGTDGWAGSWVPGYGLCPHGPIIPDALRSTTLAGRRLFFRHDIFVVAEPE